MADINTATKSYELHRGWTVRITEEFYQQVYLLNKSINCYNNIFRTMKRLNSLSLQLFS